MDTDMDVEMEAKPSLKLAVPDGDPMDLDEPLTSSSSRDSPIAVGDQPSENPGDENEANDDDDEEGYKKWILNPERKPRKISERKRADNAAFDIWIEENHEALSTSLNKSLVDDDDKTFRSLIKDFENKRIIASPRDYQLELFERAKTQNTIAVLDTGELPVCHRLLHFADTTPQDLERR